MNGRALVDLYLKSTWQEASVAYGKVVVRIQGERNALPSVSVSRPSLGEVTPVRGLEFSAQVVEASVVALVAETVVRTWTVDQWREPGLRE